MQSWQWVQQNTATMKERKMLRAVGAEDGGGPCNLLPVMDRLASTVRCVYESSGGRFQEVILTGGHARPEYKVS